jgi:hypothetical protein
MLDGEQFYRPFEFRTASADRLIEFMTFKFPGIDEYQYKKHTRLPRDHARIRPEL